MHSQFNRNGSEQRSLDRISTGASIRLFQSDPNAAMVLYSGGGFRSALAADSLQKIGYANVISLDGGFRGWKEAGFPVEK